MNNYYKSIFISGAANTINQSTQWVSNGSKSIFMYALHNVIAVVEVKGQVARDLLKLAMINIFGYVQK